MTDELSRLEPEGDEPATVGHFAESVRTVTEQMHDVCACGDWRKSHFMGRGKCATCGDGNAPPNGPDGCREFRVFKECRMTFTVISPGRCDCIRCQPDGSCDCQTCRFGEPPASPGLADGGDPS